MLLLLEEMPEQNVYWLRSGATHHARYPAKMFPFSNQVGYSKDMVDAYNNLFNSIRRNKTHVLRHYFVGKPIASRLFCERAHNFVLPPIHNRNFVSRALYRPKALDLFNSQSPLHN